MLRTVLAVLLLGASALALDNGLGLTPQMGWNTWNHFGCNISEALIRQSIDAIASTGLAAAGYRYVNLDDCWQISRDPTTHEIQSDPVAFPSGMKALADYAHAKGLLFGLYSDAGYQTCAGRPGSLNYEEIDAKTYASWDVDYLKYDNCHTDLETPMQRYPRMRDALNKTGRPIFYSMCEWGQFLPATWAQDVGNSWRTTGDITHTWTSMYNIAQTNEYWADRAAPGGWNDPDMLEVGNDGLTMDEYYTHFGIWAISKAPMIIGNDVTNMPSEILKILTAPEVIAVNQDKLGKQGKIVHRGLAYHIWAGPLADKSIAVVLVNVGSSTTKVTATWESLGLPKSTAAVVRDLWARKDVGSFIDSYTVELGSHASTMIRVIPK